MAVGMKICKVCGKSYPACRAATTGNEYRWQDVACCPEHGAEYLARVKASRGEVPVEEMKVGSADESAPATDNRDKADASAPRIGRDKKKKA